MPQPNFRLISQWPRAIWGRLLPKRGGHVSSLRIFALAIGAVILVEAGVHAVIPASKQSNEWLWDLALQLIVLFPILYFMVHKPMAAERRRARERSEFHTLTSRSLRIFNSALDERVLLSSVLPRVRQKLDVSIAGVCRVGNKKIQWAD